MCEIRCSHIGDYVDCCVLGRNAVNSCRWIPTFMRKTLPPNLVCKCSPCIDVTINVGAYPLNYMAFHHTTSLKTEIFSNQFMHYDDEKHIEMFWVALRHTFHFPDIKRIVGYYISLTTRLQILILLQGEISHIKISAKTLHIFSPTNDLNYYTWITKRNVAEHTT